jgi:hypothetical protein
MRWVACGVACSISGAFGIVNRAVISEGPRANVEVAIKKFRTRMIFFVCDPFSRR